MKTTFVFLCLSALVAVEGFADDSPAPAALSNAVIAWGKPVYGLKVGLYCETTNTDSRKLPKIYFYVANNGDTEIPGIIQRGSECIVTVNGQRYAQSSLGGKSSAMPPGRKYGPIVIDTDGLRQIPELRAWPVPAIDPTAPRPELREGTNTLRVDYIAFGFNASPAAFPRETLLFQTLMPGLDEELAVRGIALALLERAFACDPMGCRLRYGRAALVTSLLFGLGHSVTSIGGHFTILPIPFISTFGFASIAALVRTRSGSLVWPMLCHSAWDGLLFFLPMIR